MPSILIKVHTKERFLWEALFCWQCIEKIGCCSVRALADIADPTNLTEAINVLVGLWFNDWELVFETS